METLTFQDELVIEHCINCGVRFAIPINLHNRLKDVGDKQTFYCPNGHSMVFKYSVIQQENERLKKEAVYLQQAKEALHNQLTEKEIEISKLTKSITKRNKRISSGVCPCCNRTFKQLAAHMEIKHPTYSGNKKQKPNSIHTKINNKK